MKSTNIQITAFSLIVLSAACLGCNQQASSGDANVQGAVTIDGELVTRGTVKFHPVDGGPTAYGEIMKDGTYSLRVGQGVAKDLNSSKIDSGEYVATVVVTMPSSKEDRVGESGPPTPGVRITAAKYSSKETSDLLYTVKAGRNVFPIELEPMAEEELEPEQEEDGAEEGGEATEETEVTKEEANDTQEGEASASEKSESNAEVEAVEEESK